MEGKGSGWSGRERGGERQKAVANADAGVQLVGWVSWGTGGKAKPNARVEGMQQLVKLTVAAVVSLSNIAIMSSPHRLLPPLRAQMLPKLTRLRTLRVQQNDFDPQHTIDVLASLPVDLRELEMEVALDWERQAQATVLSGLARLRRLTHLRFDPGFWYPDAMLRTFDSLTELQRLTIRQDSASYASVSRWGAWWIRMFFELKHRVMRAKKQIARLEAAWEKLPGLEVDICQGREGVLLRSSVRMGAS